MDTRTCVVKPRTVRNPKRKRSEETHPPCPLCSTALLVKSKLMNDLEAIEDAFLGRVSPAEIVRIQYEYYEKTYKAPLIDLSRPYVELSEEQLREHFQTHRVSKCKMLLDDIIWTHSTQQEQMDEENLDLKTWLALSKHKHDLLKALDELRSAPAPTALLSSYEFNDL